MKLANKIGLSFLAVALIIATVAVSIFYIIAKESLRRSIYNNLGTAVVDRTNHIETYLRMLETSVGQLSKSVVLENLLKAGGKEEPQRDDAFRQAMKRLKRTKDANPSIFQFLLLDAAGKVVASSDEGMLGVDKSEDIYLLGAREGVYIKDAYFSGLAKMPLMAVAAPLLDSQTGKILGALEASVKLDELNAIVMERAGMGDTGEIYIINKDGYMITPSRFIVNTFLKQKVDTENAKMALSHKTKEHVMSGDRMFRVFPDYRGVPVLGTHEYIPRMRWGVLAEIDEEEALRPLVFLRLVFILILLIVPLSAWLLGISIARLITGPLHRLHRGTEIIGEGNLDYKVGTDARDEVGQLSRAFDAMTENIKRTTASIDDLNREITERRIAEEEREKTLLWQDGVNLLQRALLAPARIEAKLKTITDSVVRLFSADFCRIWLIRPGDLCEKGCVHAEVTEGPHVCRFRDRCLHLLASSGRYTHLDGKGHARVPFGCYKIGLVASGEAHKFLTNDVQNDPRVHNHDWARQLGLVSFAGYQLKVPGGKTIGVMALFAKHPISPTEDTILDGLSNAVSFVVQQTVAEEELKSAYERLKEAQAQVVQAAKMASVGVLAGGVAHEINNPLTSILNNVQLIKMTAEQKKEFKMEEFRKLIDIIEESSLRCKNITKLLLESSRISAETFSGVSLNEVVEKSVALIGQEMKRRNIDIRLELAPEPPRTRGSFQLLQHALLDIVSNAMWAIEKKAQGAGTITVKTCVEPGSKKACLVVSDDGVGIPKDNLQKIFEPFFTTKRVGEGTGLGLSVVYNIIRHHEGTIEAESEVNKGATFTIMLPLL
ncbi:MAG: ATP-binding protein [Candidatus Omnitrophota bacterium]